MTPKVGGGRPWGPIRAESPAARKLAETLRRHVDDSGKTLAVLSGEISMSKAQTGVYLAGKVPTQAFVVALIRATVRPELRQRRQEEALALREQAMRPVPRSTTGAPVVAGPGAGYQVELAAAQARQIETYDRLTRALEQRAEVERAKNNSDKLVMVLLNMIHQLDRRVAGLVEERDQLRAQPRSEALEDAERKLARAEEQEQRARAELRWAEEKQRQAEALEARVTDQLRRLTDELDRLRAGDTTSPLDTLPALPDEPEAGPVSADPVGDDIDAVLARASQVNDEDNTTLNRLSSELNEPATWWVVQDNPPDNPTHQEAKGRRGYAVSVREAEAPERNTSRRHKLTASQTRSQPAKAPPTTSSSNPALEYALRAIRSGTLTWEQRREQFRPGSVWHTAARMVRNEPGSAKKSSSSSYSPTPRTAAPPASPSARARDLHAGMTWDERRAQFRKKT
ncbi:hypothetical protein [Streptomyces microflavus]|uniref:hypothetical protein n=1 Tax=Streptomyces microflavus TaxID=1919 RepID=UPI002E2FC8FD|nr:hypothetical protein [Streptomyces microflavus]